MVNSTRSIGFTDAFKLFEKAGKLAKQSIKVYILQFPELKETMKDILTNFAVFDVVDGCEALKETAESVKKVVEAVRLFEVKATLVNFTDTLSNMAEIGDAVESTWDALSELGYGVVPEILTEAMKYIGPIVLVYGGVKGAYSTYKVYKEMKVYEKAFANCYMLNATPNAKIAYLAQVETGAAKLYAGQTKDAIKKRDAMIETANKITGVVGKESDNFSAQKSNMKRQMIMDGFVAASNLGLGVAATVGLITPVAPAILTGMSFGKAAIKLGTTVVTKFSIGEKNLVAAAA